jgi:hypothetical protein
MKSITWPECHPVQMRSARMSWSYRGRRHRTLGAESQARVPVVVLSGDA